MNEGKRLLVILDLNGTLLHKCRYSPSALPQPSTSSSNSRTITHNTDECNCKFKRLGSFDVAVWTSAAGHNALAMVDLITTICPAFSTSSLKFLWSRDECDIKDWTKEEYENMKRLNGGKYVKPIAYKDLQIVWNRFPGKYFPSNTIIVDDSREKMKNMDNCILVESFDVNKFYEDSGDTGAGLLRLIKYLEKLKTESSTFSDVREFLQQTEYLATSI